MSEEMKNLNNEPEQAPVEEKVEEKKPLSKTTIGIICGAVAAVVVLVLVLVLALGGNKTPDNTPDDPDQGQTPSTPETPAVTDKEYTLGLGLVFGEFKATETNATIATVVTDKDGKIVACKIDAVQNKYSITEDGVNFTVLETKKELGDRYGMATSPYKSDNNGDNVVKEWDKQAEAFEAYVIGKTAAELEALELQEVNKHMISKDDSLLNAGCTIQIGDFIAAVVKACKDEQSMAFKTQGDVVLGLGVNNADNGTKGDDIEATVKMNVDFAAVVTVDGKIVAALNDATQPELKVEDGAVISKSVGKGKDILMTKRELKEKYAMGQESITEANKWMDNNGDNKVLEWYLQSAEFSKYLVGKTAADVEGLKTQFVGGHHISTDDALLNAGCTIQITGMKDVVLEALGYEDYTLGLGVVVDLNTSATGNAQIDGTVATVVLDRHGKIVLCRIDAIQNKISVTDGFLPESMPTFKTKMELGDAYGMTAALGYYMDWNNDGVVKEWYEQAKAFENWCVGKTVAEVEAMGTHVVEGHGYVISADADLLAAGCTIQITDFKAAVIKACTDDQSMAFTAKDAITLGVAVDSYNDSSTEADEGKDGVVQVYSDIAASAIVNGKIIASLNDAIQPKISFNVNGEITAKNFAGTKRELKEGYGMSTSPWSPDNDGDGRVLEWYIQSAEFSKYVIGMTGAEVKDLATKNLNDHNVSADDALLNAGCTIQITGIKAVVAKSVENAR